MDLQHPNQVTGGTRKRLWVAVSTEGEGTTDRIGVGAWAELHLSPMSNRRETPRTGRREGGDRDELKREPKEAGDGLFCEDILARHDTAVRHAQLSY